MEYFERKICKIYVQKNFFQEFTIANIIIHIFYILIVFQVNLCPCNVCMRHFLAILMQLLVAKEMILLTYKQMLVLSCCNVTVNDFLRLIHNDHIWFTMASN